MVNALIVAGIVLVYCAAWILGLWHGLKHGKPPDDAPDDNAENPPE